MSRTRSFRRDVRNRKIAHRKRLCRELYGYDWYIKGRHSSKDCLPGELFSAYLNRIKAGCDGKYSKGKIHCSCKMCTYSKYYGLPTFRDMKEREKFKEAISNY